MDLEFALNVTLNFEQDFRVFPCVYSLKKHVTNGVVYENNATFVM
jgi:hypothetical protein